MGERVTNLVNTDGAYEVTEKLWLKKAIEAGKTRFFSGSWPTERKERPVELLPDITVRSEHFGSMYSLFGEFGTSLFHVSVKMGKAWADIASNTKDESEKTIATLQEIFPKSNPPEGSLPISIWYKSPNGNETYDRDIEVPSWEKIQKNYPQKTREDLGRIVRWQEFPALGKLMLWHGSPGTGKTFAVRALANQWRDWCKMNYVSDPESLLSDPSYMLKVLIEDQSEDHYKEETSLKKGKLLVLEDAGELIKADAKEQFGQGLSRLLNMTDGIIGQGFRYLVLITTNDEIRKMNDAVTRPGRCVAQVNFASFTPQEAQVWAQENNIDLPPNRKQLSLSELYLLKSGEPLPSQPRGLGF